MKPDFLYDMLKKYYDEDTINKIFLGYSKKRYTTIRINTIKSNVASIKTILNKENIEFEDVSFYENALIIKNKNEIDIRALDIYKNGLIYMQSLSSMIPPIILNPKENERILDMTASPGGKTLEIACLTNNNSFITACEKNKIRYDRLKYNIDKQGAKKVTVLNIDAKALDDLFSFDKVLLDAPCSGSGTLNMPINESYFNKKLIENSIKLQEELLTKALKVLKKGEVMVYSTCSILKEENEFLLNKVLKKFDASILPIEKLNDIPLLPVNINGVMCICPSELYEGFFVAKIQKNS
jgi:NOL1/NOP2/sun family putative RNA methylase